MVQRYDIDTEGYSRECESGEFVTYEDYAALSNAIDSLLFAVKKGHLTVDHVQGYLEAIQKGFSL